MPLTNGTTNVHCDEIDQPAGSWVVKTKAIPPNCQQMIMDGTFKKEAKLPQRTRTFGWTTAQL
jgi:hypothetical protein